MTCALFNGFRAKLSLQLLVNEIAHKLKEKTLSSAYIIAEAGINHNGDIDIAKKLINIAALAGCDAVKFQKRTPDICVPENMKPMMRSTPWGEMTYLEYKKKIEFGKEEYDEIDSYAKSLTIDWSASAWDIPSLQFLDNYNLPFHKVASAMTTNLEFLKEVALRKKLTYVSTGMCSWENIDKAVEIFKFAKCPIVLMHTTSVYPADDAFLNLKLIETMARRYPEIPIGYSGHEASISPSIVAVTLGASVLERHITLDRSMWGTDHSASLEPTGLNQLVGAIRKISIVLGSGERVSIPQEEEVAKKLRYWL